MIGIIGGIIALVHIAQQGGNMSHEHDTDTDSLPLDIPARNRTGYRSARSCHWQVSCRAQRQDRGGLRALDQLNVQVVSTLEALWSKRGAEIIDQLAAERPEVVAQLVARLIPTALAEQAITGSDDKVESNQEVTIKVVTQQHQDVLPPREVEGELLLDEHYHALSWCMFGIDLYLTVEH